MTAQAGRGMTSVLASLLQQFFPKTFEDLIPNPPRTVPLDGEQLRIWAQIRDVLTHKELCRDLVRPGNFRAYPGSSPEICARDLARSWQLATAEEKEFQAMIYNRHILLTELGTRMMYVIRKDVRDDPEWDVFVSRAIDILGAEALGFDPKQDRKTLVTRDHGGRTVGSRKLP